MRPSSHISRRSLSTLSFTCPAATSASLTVLLGTIEGNNRGQAFGSPLDLSRLQMRAVLDATAFAAATLTYQFGTFLAVLRHVARGTRGPRH